jgi:hypothetical protein
MTFRKSVFKFFLSIMSFILPGVPTTTWIPPSFSAFLSSLGSVPPIRHLEFIFKNSLKQKITLFICWASYRVGANMIAWQWGDLGSISWSTPIAKVAVLPVPDWAWAMVSFLLMTGNIPFCWIMDGFSKPKAKLDVSLTIDPSKEIRIEIEFLKCVDGL